MVEYGEQGYATTFYIRVGVVSDERRLSLAQYDDPDATMETHTTHMGVEATKFLACVEGSEGSLTFLEGQQ